MKPYVIIPARMESRRLPNKPLLDCGGRPLIYRTWCNAVAWASKDRVAVATDSRDLAAICEGFGAKVVMTDPDARSGSQRVFEAWARSNIDDASCLVDLQCDEPEVTPAMLDVLASALRQGRLVAAMREGKRSAKEPRIATLTGPFRMIGDAEDPNEVKVVVSDDWTALYFSRRGLTGAHRHVGVYVFEPTVVPALAQCEDSKIGRAESLEQLDWLCAGERIAVGRIKGIPRSVNTEADLIGVRAGLQADGKVD